MHWCLLHCAVSVIILQHSHNCVVHGESVRYMQACSPHRALTQVWHLLPGACCLLRHWHPCICYTLECSIHHSSGSSQSDSGKDMQLGRRRQGYSIPGHKCI